jgi:hypothetical protein
MYVRYPSRVVDLGFNGLRYKHEYWANSEYQQLHLARDLIEAGIDVDHIILSRSGAKTDLLCGEPAPFGVYFSESSGRQCRPCLALQTAKGSLQIHFGCNKLHCGELCGTLRLFSFQTQSVYYYATEDLHLLQFTHTEHDGYAHYVNHETGARLDKWFRADIATPDLRQWCSAAMQKGMLEHRQKLAKEMPSSPTKPMTFYCGVMHDTSLPLVTPENPMAATSEANATP